MILNSGHYVMLLWNEFKEHGFVIDSIAKFNEETQALDEIIGTLTRAAKAQQCIAQKI